MERCRDVLERIECGLLGVNDVCTADERREAVSSDCWAKLVVSGVGCV